MSISQSFNSCLKALKEVLGSLENRSKEPLGKWRDELGRFQVWAANIGAHQTGQSSLDFRLRDASHIQQQIIHLLNDLDELISEVHIVLSEQGSELSEVEEDGSKRDTLAHEEVLESEFEQLYGCLVSIINCLFQMSMLVRKPARRKCPTDTQFESSFRPFDIQHVLNKYPNCDREVIERLGRANSRRRANLKYRERHRLKLGKDLEGAQDGSELSDTIATDFTNLNVGQEDSNSVSGHSQTSYASSLISGSALTVPPRPKESADGNPFECPFCFWVITTEHSHSWSRHVFKDLMPYVCPFLGCPAPEKLYDSRHDWYRHLQIGHPDIVENRVCPLCNSAIESSVAFERHLARHLEDLALFVLPSRDEDESDNEEESDKEDAPESPLITEGDDQPLPSTGASADVHHNDNPDSFLPEQESRNLSSETALEGRSSSAEGVNWLLEGGGGGGGGGGRMRLWYCCQCHSDPTAIDIQLRCIICGHQKCSRCDYH